MKNPGVLLPILTEDGQISVFDALPDRLDWPELRTAWAHRDVTLPYCFTAPEEKLEVFFSYACRKAKLPMSVGTVFNPGWSTLFLNELKHDSLLLSAGLVTYVTQKRLFAEQLPNLKQCVVVGYQNSEQISELERLYPGIDIRVLTHPMHTIADCKC